MYKHLLFKGQDEDGNVYCRPLSSSGLIKTAQAMGHDLSPTIQDFISSISPSDRGMRVLVSALGALEYYGPNNNGDGFEEAALMHAPPDWSSLSLDEMRRVAKTWPYGYPTFLNAYPYKHHVNKDPAKAFGKVEIASWNPIMHRVELIVYLDRALCEKQGAIDVYDRISQGEYPSTSMGCKVPYDVCSICGNKSKTRNDYCEHAQYMMGKILPDGRKVFVYNPHPRFFDISFVFIGADKTSRVLARLPEETTSDPISDFLTSAPKTSVTIIRRRSISLPGDLEKLGSLNRISEKNASHKKLSQLIKEITVSGFAKRLLPRIERSEPYFPPSLLDFLARRHSMNTCCSTLGSLGMILKPREFQRIVLVKIGEDAWANELDKRNVVFAPSEEVEEEIGIEPRFVEESLIDKLQPYVEDRSAAEPFLSNRELKEVNPKESYTKDPFLQKVANAYNGYRQSLLYSMNSLLNQSALSFDHGHLTVEDIFGKRKVASNVNVSGPNSFAYLIGAYYDDRGKLFANTKTADILGSLDPNMAVTLSSETE